LSSPTRARPRARSLDSLAGADRRPAARLLPRLAFLALLGGGLLYWAQLRRPRELRLELDLTGALPGEISSVDVVVRRGEHALARHEARFGPQGAPATVQMLLRAAPGEAEVETTLGYLGRPARRFLARVQLSEEEPARVRPL